MSRSGYSAAVLRGAILRGYTEARLSRLLKTTAPKINEILNDQSELSEPQLTLLERETGMTAGQLAASDLTPPDGEFTKLMDSWAQLSGPPPLPLRKSRAKAQPEALK